MPRPVDSNDTYMPMLLKNIPSEVVAAHVAIIGVTSAASAPGFVMWIAFGLGLVATPLWLFFGQKVKSWLQLMLATFAFVIWDMSLNGGAFHSIEGYKTYIGAIVLVVFTMLIAPLLTHIFKPSS